MAFLKFDASHVEATKLTELKKIYEKDVAKFHTDLIKKSGPGNDFLGWVDYPNQDHTALFAKMKKITKLWHSKKLTDVVIIGMGGSYTGVKAIIEMALPDPTKRKMQVHFMRSLSSSNLKVVLDNVKNKNWGIIVISKSGTTLESALGFKLARTALATQYKKDFGWRIVAITDPEKGVLHDLCVAHKYTMLPIDSDIGGRFSSITPVGLLPAMLCGINAEKVLKGAKDAYDVLIKNSSLDKNSAALYACYRHFLYKKSKLAIEIFISYENNLEDTLLQHRQLFGESEGKDGDALFPTFSVFTTDLHSMGQLYQQGVRNFFETVLTFNKPIANLKMTKSIFKDDDHLDYLNSKTVHDINQAACEATIAAHEDAGVPILKIELEEMSEYAFGYFYYWLCFATAISARLLKHNPFNQPGVEAYKQNMFKLLGKK
ncbi:glucose-6-phosphate isomerase [[Mycoplasma] testudinis]|uniref:glucose-6-phosphate isomerase n=1 Tax=[Mycoplasma] testudinis TaxID=33924 RepID=UPI0004866305|nr:glucose-6-phosphate isomerase [[Mycoplasma] testudinis]